MKSCFALCRLNGFTMSKKCWLNCSVMKNAGELIVVEKNQQLHNFHRIRVNISECVWGRSRRWRGVSWIWKVHSLIIDTSATTLMYNWGFVCGYVFGFILVMPCWNINWLLWLFMNALVVMSLNELWLVMVGWIEMFGLWFGMYWNFVVMV